MQRLRTMHLFAGAGGGILADLLLGHQPVCAVEINEYCQQVLSARQKDGCLPWFPIFADVQKFDGRAWRGHVDVVSGGFPCQDISAAGRGAGIEGERSGLWVEMARIIREVRPRFAFVENSPMLTARGLGTVLGDLAEMGFDARWGVLGASNCGLAHKRERIWIVAHAHAGHEHGRRGAKQVGRSRSAEEIEADGFILRPQWPAEPGVPIVAHGVARRVDKLGAIGNGQVPCVAASAWRLLSSNA